MSDALVGEVVRGDLKPFVPLPPDLLHFTTHHVDLPNGGQVTGMDRSDAITMAVTLGTRAYEAHAVLVRASGLVVMEPLRQIL